jgi:hypothetical protein
MPSSHFNQLNEIVDLICLADPDKLLDIGAGFGKYGFLAREYLELWNDGGDYRKWNRLIDGIEAFEPYITPVHRFIYNNVYIGNALDILPEITTKYDLIMMIDVFEHFTFEEGKKMLELCRKTARNVLISVPVCMSAQEAVFDNQFEIHRYPWKRKDFKDIPDKFFLSNPKSTICLIGEDAIRISKIIRRRNLRQRTINILNFLRIKNAIKYIVKAK